MGTIGSKHLKLFRNFSPLIFVLSAACRSRRAAADFERFTLHWSLNTQHVLDESIEKWFSAAFSLFLIIARSRTSCWLWCLIWTKTNCTARLEIKKIFRKFLKTTKFQNSTFWTNCKNPFSKKTLLIWFYHSSLDHWMLSQLSLTIFGRHK